MITSLFSYVVFVDVDASKKTRNEISCRNALSTFRNLYSGATSCNNFWFL